MTERRPALRIIHLLGGLRVFDLGGETIGVGVDGLKRFMYFSSVPYGAVNQVLGRLGLRPIGAHFITSPDDLDGFQPTDWQSYDAGRGYCCMDAAREWTNVRHAHIDRSDWAVAHIAGKVGTYLQLLNRRLFHLSDAYHSALRSKLRGRAVDALMKPTKFSNMWQDEVDAAIHAFFADAAALRDALAEACWKLVLKKPSSDVSKMATLIKKTKFEAVPQLITQIQKQAKDGWINSLTDIRNEIIHVVPVSKAHEFSYLEIRELKLKDCTLPALHYPLTTSDWNLRRDVQRAVPYGDKEAFKRVAEAYDEFAKTSGDALEYACRTLTSLAELAESVRSAAGLKADIPTITPKPGSFRVIRRTWDSTPPNSGEPPSDDSE